MIDKIARIYALDLNNGTLIWETNFRGLSTNSSPLSRSTAALEGTNVVFGYGNGLMDVNATTGKFIWQSKDPTQTESISSTIIGPASEAVVVTGDVGGSFRRGFAGDRPPTLHLCDRRVNHNAPRHCVTGT